MKAGLVNAVCDLEASRRYREAQTLWLANTTAEDRAAISALQACFAEALRPVACAIAQLDAAKGGSDGTLSAYKAAASDPAIPEERRRPWRVLFDAGLAFPEFFDLAIHLPRILARPGRPSGPGKELRLALENIRRRMVEGLDQGAAISAHVRDFGKSSAATVKGRKDYLRKAINSGKY